MNTQSVSHIPLMHAVMSGVRACVPLARVQHAQISSLRLPRLPGKHNIWCSGEWEGTLTPIFENKTNNSSRGSSGVPPPVSGGSNGNFEELGYKD